MSHIELPDYGENDPCTPNPVAYAQKAIYAVMCCGDWFTVRQLSRLAKVSDPRGNIRTMIERGYRFQKMWDTNEHGIRYKLYRLDMHYRGYLPRYGLSNAVVEMRELPF